MTRIFRLVVHTIALCGFLVLLSGLAIGQTASLAGTVTDTRGAVVSEAEVTVKNTGTGLTRSARTSERGTFSVTNLPVGLYEITVSKTGFKVFRVSNAQVAVAQVLSLNPKLEPGVVT